MAKDPRFDPNYQKNVQGDRAKKNSNVEKRTNNKITSDEIANSSIYSNHIANGAVTPEKLSQKPAFLVGWNDSISLTTTATIIPLNGTLSFNRGGNLDTTNNRFICPVEGLYMFGYSYLRNPSAIVVRANVYKNGSRLPQQLRSPEGFSGYNYTAGQWIIAYGNINDYFDLRISSDSATSLYNDSGTLSYNWFCGYLVG